MNAAPRPTSTRYLRQETLPGFGAAGQTALTAARVLVIGAGGLGSSVLPALAAAGVGTIGVIDDDTVEMSNLHRQYLHSEADVGRDKVASAVDTLRALNSQISVVGHTERLSTSNALQLFAGYDVVIDGSDNFPTRYLANDAAALSGIPLVWGAVSQYGGQAGVCWAAHGPQYRDLFPSPPAPGSVLSCAVGGVLPTVCAVIGAILATETIKLITGVGTPLLGKVTTFDALTGGFREIAYAKDPSATPITELIDYDLFCGITPVSDTISASELAEEIAHGHTRDSALSTSGAEQTRENAGWNAGQDAGQADVTAAAITLLDVREPWEVQVVHLPGAVVIPLGLLEGELDQGIAGLDPHSPVVVYCHHGVRSATALDMLHRHGFTAARHLEGGIDAWAKTVDPTLPRY